MIAQLLLALFSIPLPLSSANTAVRFTVDSTWHLIEGEAKEVTGWIVEDSVGTTHVEAKLGVASFDSDNSHRDSRLREVMAADQFPEVIFSGESAEDGCKLRSLNEGNSCKRLLNGQLSIRNVTKPIVLSVNVERVGNMIHLTGEGDLRWDEFGVEDPSILIAKLNKVVHILVKIKTPLVP